MIRYEVGHVTVGLFLTVSLALAHPGLASGQQSQKAKSRQEGVSPSSSPRRESKDPKPMRGPKRSVLNRCTVRVQPPNAPATSRRREWSFSARELSDLRFDLWILESRSSEPAEVRVYAPGDRLYKVLRVAPSPSAMTARSSRALSRRGLSVLSAPMPLVGTHVTSRSLYGEWRVEGWFAGAEEACSRPVDFVLEP